MIILINGDTLQVVLSGATTTDEPEFLASWADDGTTDQLNRTTGETNGVTPVTLVAGPSATETRVVRAIQIYNKDSASVTIKVQILNGGVTRVIHQETLEPGKSANYNGGQWAAVSCLTTHNQLLERDVAGTHPTLKAAANSDQTIQMADAAGAYKTSFRDSAGVEVASVDSDGAATFTSIPSPGAIGGTTPPTIAATTLDANTATLDNGTSNSELLFEESTANRARIRYDTTANDLTIGTATNTGLFSDAIIIDGEVVTSNRVVTITACEKLLLNTGTDLDLNSNSLLNLPSGTFTPTEASVTITASGRYTELSDSTVAVWMTLQWPTTSNTNNNSIGSLPFTVFNNGDSRGGLSIAVCTQGTAMTAQLDQNATTFSLRDFSGNFFTNAQLSGSAIRVAGVYEKV